MFFIDAPLAVIETERRYQEYRAACREIGVKPNPRPEPLKIDKQEDRNGGSCFMFGIGFLLGLWL